MNDEEKMDEDEEGNRDEEIRDEEQEEEHQKARAIASPDIPSRREVEDHNLTHIPFRSWKNLCLRGRRSAHKRRPNEGQGANDIAVTTFSIDYMYLTEEDLAKERRRSSDGQRTHDIGTTDHRARGQEDWRITRTPSQV